MSVASAIGLLQSARGAEDDEQSYYIEKADQALPDGHAAADPLADVVDGVVDAETGISAALAALQADGERDRQAPHTDIPNSDMTALQAVVAARDVLRGIDSGHVDGRTDSHVLNALEQLDTIILDAPGEALASLESTASAEGDAPSSEETSPEEVKRRQAEAAAEEEVPITIELSSAFIGLIDMVRDAEDEESVTDWIKNTIHGDLAKHDHEFWNAVEADVEVELPPDVGQWARLWADYYTAHGSEPAHPDDKFLDYVDLNYEWQVEREDETASDDGDSSKPDSNSAGGGRDHE